jgi:hypothetical protein
VADAVGPPLAACVCGEFRGAPDAEAAPAWLDSRGVSQGVDPAGHLATERVGCQKLRGQRRIEMKY